MQEIINQPDEIVECWGEAGVQLHRVADWAIPDEAPAYWQEIQWYSMPHPCLAPDLLKRYVRAMVSPHGDYDGGRIIAPSFEILYLYGK